MVVVVVTTVLALSVYLETCIRRNKKNGKKLVWVEAAEYSGQKPNRDELFLQVTQREVELGKLKELRQAAAVALLFNFALPPIFQNQPILEQFLGTIFECYRSRVFQKYILKHKLRSKHWRTWKKSPSDSHS